MNRGLQLTRVVNSCILLEFGGGAILTDPYFQDRWWYHFAEPIGLRVEQLPKLSVILGGHGVFDHWQPQSLASYPYKRTTPVFVATRTMALQARKAGFSQVEQLDWGEARILPCGLKVESPESQMVMGAKTNNYIVGGADWRIFIGTEARDLEPLWRYRLNHAPVDVVLAPINGARLFGRKLVMSPVEAIEAARILGAHTLVPFHYAMKPRFLMMQTPCSLSDLEQLRLSAPNLEIVAVEPGVKRAIGVHELSAASD